MISRHFDEAPRDRDTEKPWDMEPDDDNWSYDGEPETYRPGSTILYAIMIGMGVVAVVIVVGQWLA
jgi:hypothetical protein